MEQDSGRFERNLGGVCGGLFPVKDVLNIFFGDIEPIAIPDSALQEDLDRDWKFFDPGIIEVVEAIVLLPCVGKVLEECRVEGIGLVLLHDT